MKTFSDEHRRKLSEAAKKRARKPHSEEAKKKIADSWSTERRANHQKNMRDYWEQRRHAGVTLSTTSALEPSEASVLDVASITLS